MANSTHTVIGAGQIGRLLASHLAAEGASVRLVHRGHTASAETPKGVTWMAGDARDAALMAEACAGAQAVYNCACPRDYARWEGQIQELFRGVWSAAARAGARLVQLDNLYMYGRPPSVPFNESTPETPASNKGELRRALAEELLDLERRGTLDVAIGRASDFIGPHLPSTAVFRAATLETLKRGGRVFVPGNPDAPHAYSYVRDVVRGLAALGHHPAASGRVFFLPVVNTGSTRDLLSVMAERAGTRVRVSGSPTWLFRAAGLVSPLMRALAEMNYLFEVPFVPDDRAIRETLGVTHTPLDEVIAHTLA